MTDSDIEKNHDWLFIDMYRTSAPINEPITVSIPITELIIDTILKIAVIMSL